MNLFDAAIFDSAIFDTGATAPQTLPPYFWGAMERKKRRRKEQDEHAAREALRIEAERLAREAWEQEQAERAHSELEHARWLKDLGRMVSEYEAAQATAQQIQAEATRIVAALIADLQATAQRIARHRDDEDAMAVLLLA